MKSMARGLLIWLLLWVAVIARADAGPAVLGEASVVVGVALVEEAGAKRPLERGTSLREGVTLETGANGFIYVNTLDGGFISLRPNSSLTVEAYAYNGNAPAESHIKLRLNRGVVRAISGKGAQAARERFRMNTPVAAIGIRGTDFSVFTSEATTRVSVRSGGIVMSPFVGGCSLSGSGPCEGSAGRELSSQRRGDILQINHGDAQPTLLGPQFQHLAPDVVSPPGKDEVAGGGAQDRAAEPAVPAAAMANEIAFDGAVRDVPPRQPKPPVVEPPVVVRPPPPPEPPEPQKIFWGRYQKLADLPPNTSTEALLDGVRKMVAFGAYGPFAITRDNRDGMVMPKTDSFRFQLKGSEAYVVSDGGSKAIAAAISDPSLVIDFAKRRFDTSLIITTDKLSHRMNAHGSVLPDGSMRSDQIGSNANVRGALAGKDATQAGYAFSSDAGAGQTALGVTLWGR